MNVNNKSDKGIIHEQKLFFSVQFHPEAFDVFLENVNRVSLPPPDPLLGAASRLRRSTNWPDR
jgi:hypothetical protein